MPVSGAAPNNNDVLKFDGTQWVPAPGSSGFELPFSATEDENVPLFDLTNEGDGIAARFTINNAGATSPALMVQSNGTSGWGGLFQYHSGSGSALRAESNSTVGGYAIEALVTGSGAGAGYFHIQHPTNQKNALLAENLGEGHAINARTTKQGHALIAAASGSGNGIYAANSGTGRAGEFRITTINNANPALVVHTLSSNGSAIRAETTGGGSVGTFISSNPSNNSPAVRINSSATGSGLSIQATGNGRGIEVNLSQSANPNSALVVSSASSTAPAVDLRNTQAPATLSTRNQGGGKAAEFINTSANNSTVTVQNTSTGGAAEFRSNGATRTLYVQNSSASGSAAEFRNSSSTQTITVTNFSTGGAASFSSEAMAGLTPTVNIQRAGGSGPALAVAHNGEGAVATFTDGATGDGTGHVLVVHRVNQNTTTDVFRVNSRGTGNLAVFRVNNSNVARINAAGRGFFNAGTQNSGADVAEAFDVIGSIDQYEPGDVLVISLDEDRTVEKSAEPYSDLVAGVYATKPGVLLTEKDIDQDLSGMAPMGVVGVIPTKVCLEGGPIKRGDLLVTSSIPGVAMKADKDKVRPGQVIGKALQEFQRGGIGKIKVLVNVK